MYTFTYAHACMRVFHVRQDIPCTFCENSDAYVLKLAMRTLEKAKPAATEPVDLCLDVEMSNKTSNKRNHVCELSRSLISTLRYSQFA